MNYPTGKKMKNNIFVNHANRGMGLERDLDTTNYHYLVQNRAVVHKKPTPIQIVKVDYKNRGMATIKEAYFSKPSTTDYNGIIQKGIYIDFEAKETKNKTSFPLKNIHQHQITHMKAVLKQSGICFFLIRMGNKQTYLLDSNIIIDYWENQNIDGRKSIPFQVLASEGHLVPGTYTTPVDYLAVVEKVYMS